jgi:hypothetical protein
MTLQHLVGKSSGLQRSVLAVTLAVASLAFAGPVSDKEGEAALKEARTLIAARKFDDAAVRLEKCSNATGPVRATCYKMLGSTYAKIGARDNKPEYVAKARAAYERFLEVAEPGDESRAIVKKILEASAP